MTTATTAPITTPSVEMREFQTDVMRMNMGPQHPSTHGVLRIKLELDGEKVLKAEPMIGYLHRGIEKLAETKRYNQVIPLLDRMDYLAAMCFNLGFVLAVEKLFDVQLPPRGQYIRVIMCEIARLASHCIWLGAHAMDVGAITVFLYTFRERELAYDIFEHICGQRMTVSYMRVGGLMNDMDDECVTMIKKYIETMKQRIEEYNRLLTKNPIWMDRTIGIGHMTAQECMDMNITGPCARGCGIDWDLRRDQPYSAYDQFEFEVPVYQAGDVYARYLQRIDEMRQSVRILEQAINRLPDGPFNVDNFKIILPPKELVKRDMEAMIHHFKLTIDGCKPPKGEIYMPTESPRGELGFYIQSDGSGKPYRMKVRNPTMINLQSLGRMCQGHFLADVVAVIGTLDVVLGEVDK